jgi:GNAT superfamily N-acetyltransferase
MAFRWIHENPPVWDAAKARVIGAAPPGVFVLGPVSDGAVLPGDWWRVEDGAEIIAYGQMDHSWGDAEVLLAVDPGRQKGGVGTFILDRLEDEAHARGINYLYNVVPDAHPDHDGLTRWLQRRGFEASREGGLLRRAVRR